jgi:beta-phosphoglucomutase-like phosphatase (HAD superfamily)
MLDVRNLLFQIKSYGIPTAVISNLDQALLEKQVAMLKLTGDFELIVGSARKPEHFLLIQAT